MYDPNTVLLHTKANPTVRIIHHYMPVQKEGFPKGVSCWCGNSLEFGVRESYHSREKKRKAFFTLHDECQPKESK